MNIKTKLELGDILYFKNDPEQREFILIGVIARPGCIVLELRYDGDLIEAYEFEVSKEKDDLKSMGLDSKEEK